MKKVVSVDLNEDGTIKGLLFEGNKRATPLKTVIRMLEDNKDMDFGDSGIQVVTKKDGSKYLRSTPNDIIEDNFGHMAEEVKAEEATKDELWYGIQEAQKSNPGLLAKLRGLLGF